MSDDIHSLDDVDTEIIKRDGWRLGKMFIANLENTMPTYEEAIIYAEEQLDSQKVALRSVVIKNRVYWEVYIKD